MKFMADRAELGEELSCKSDLQLSTCSLSEMPRTGPRWMRFIKCCSSKQNKLRAGHIASVDLTIAFLSR